MFVVMEKKKVVERIFLTQSNTDLRIFKREEKHLGSAATGNPNTFQPKEGWVSGTRRDF